MEPEHWHTVLMGRWRDTSEHITLKEGRALILALRRLARNQNSRNRKQILVDNMALAMTSCKGRATNYGMLRIMQQAAAISLAGNSSYRLRWVASELNVADGPSRGQIRPGSYQGIPNSSEEPTQEQEGFGQQLEESYGGQVAQPSAHISLSEGDIQGHSEQEEEVFPSLGERAEVCKEDAGESIRNRSRGWNPRQEEQTHHVGETIHLAGSGIPVCEALPGLLEFLPGARIRAATSFRHGCKPC